MSSIEAATLSDGLLEVHGNEIHRTTPLRVGPMIVQMARTAVRDRHRNGLHTGFIELRDPYDAAVRLTDWERDRLLIFSAAELAGAIAPRD